MPYRYWVPQVPEAFDELGNPADVLVVPKKNPGFSAETDLVYDSEEKS